MLNTTTDTARHPNALAGLTALAAFASASILPALTAALCSAAALAGDAPVVVYADASGGDAVFRLSRDGSTVLRSYFPTVKSPVQNDVWTEATGVFTLPNPAGGPWIASSLNGDGSVIAGRTNPSGALSQAAIFDRTAGGFVAGADAYATCAVAPNPPGAPSSGVARFRAFLSKPVSGVDFYRPFVGFVPYAPPYDAAMPIVQAVNFAADQCGGVSYLFAGGVLRARPFLSRDNPGHPLREITVPAPDDNGEVLFFSNGGSRVLLSTWRTLPDGSLRHRLVRWTSAENYEVAEIPGGAAALTVYGVDDGLDTIVFNATTPAGGPSPLTVWTSDGGFMTANAYLEAHGATPGFTASALGISGDGRTLLAGLSNNSIVLFRGLADEACGGTESCVVVHATPGCGDTQCCQTVCEIDPYCCTTMWDSICVDRAQELCIGCGVAGSGSCTEVHATAGCDDGVCCTAVCAVDEFCCAVQWDAACRDRALATCRSGDTCAEAKLLTAAVPESFLLDSTGSAPDGVVTPCGTSDTIATWRLWRAPCSGVATMTVCTPNFLQTQGVIAVYEACGGPAIACSDGSEACSWPTGVTLEFVAIAGREYLVRFSAEQGGLHLSPGGLLPIQCTQVCGVGEPCSVAHASGGCSNASCCETVCTTDPFCCTNEWDALCVNGAQVLCPDPSDLNADGAIDAADLAIMLGGWGTAGPTDINGDGTTDAADLAVLLGSWG